VTFTITGPNPVPSITALNPTGVLVGGGAFALTITGSNFVQGAFVRFNGVDRAASSVSPTQVVVTIPAEDIATAGPKPVVVVNPGPGGGPSNTVIFTVGSPNPAPTLATISPLQAVAGSSGFTLVATGTGFVPGVTVLRWNGAPRATTVINGTQLNAQILASDLTTPGTVQVTVFNPEPSGGTSNALSFAIINPLPVISSINPSDAPIGSQAVTVNVSGSGFVPGSVVRWNGNDRTTQFVSPTLLMATIPASDLTAATIANITVFNPTPGGGTSNAVSFNVQAPSGAPVLNTLNPSFAIVGRQGFVLNVLGSGFVPGSVVLWNGAGRPTQFVNQGQLQATIPASDIAFVGTASVQVLNPPPGGGLSIARVFTIARELTSVNAASFLPGMIAQDSIVASFGTNLATGSQNANSTPLPEVLLGTRVQVRDSANNTFNARIFAVTPGQVNWSMPHVAAGQATVTITSGSGDVSIGTIDVAAVAPGLFSATASGQGLAAAQVIRVRNGVQTYENVALVTVVGGSVVATPIPINLGPATDEVYLAFYGTGFRNRTSLNNVSAQLGGQAIGIQFAGAQGTFEGEDQLNTVRIPRSYIGRGVVNFVLTVDNKVTNTVQVSFQ